MNTYSSVKLQRSWKSKPGFLESHKDKWAFIFFIPLFSSVFLILFQPFGVNNYDPSHQIRPELLYGVGTMALFQFITLTANEWLIAPLLFKEKNWLQLILWIIWSCFLVGSVTFIIYNWMGNFHDWTWSSYFGFLRDCTNTALIPVFLLFLYFHNKKTQNHLLRLKDQMWASMGKNEMAYITSENGKEQLAIKVEQLLYLESQDNYVAVFYLDSENKLQKKLIRTSLKKLELLFEKAPIVRCHRSYMVNMLKASYAVGNAHQLQLMLQNISRSLPVSRKYVDQIKTILQQRARDGHSSLISEVQP